MIKVLYGPKGIGKSRRLLAMANDSYTERGENSVFIDKDSDRMYALDRNIRFINSSDFSIDGPKMFSGFLSGIAAQDFDLEAIYINSFMAVVHHPLAELKGMFEFLDDFSRRCKVDLIISLSSETDAPEFVKPYLI